MKRTLYLVRHAAVDVSPGSCYGRSDVALVEPVARHAQWLAAMLPREIAIFTSPLSRCLSLAQALATSHGALHVDARLAEMYFGEWEMQRYDAIPRAQIDAWAGDPLGFRTPGGESGDAVIARVEVALTDILALHTNALIVSHGGPLRIITGKLLGLAREHWLSQDIALASLTILREEGGIWQAETRRMPKQSQ